MVEPFCLVLPSGVSFLAEVVTTVLALEARGARFDVVDGLIAVTPPGVLTPHERALLVAHKPEVIRLLAYQAPDPHLRAQ